ncbi:uncharacterized protein LOC105185666 isoform X2 [Harpegnathos saltator]|uniref:Transcriptional regulator ATRX n=1 Tax=Harpegnathos saltator TaxID=610380 RepID=E2BR41_HARSA|nr:uncharacterized protein LOC105185666 isoform X2 [Harpegnathos saltator]EFN81847.1 Transcriptional regulator ATRX [Harpegnathos saltator]
MDISSMLEVQVKEVKVEVDIKENVTPRDQTSSTTIEPVPVSQEEADYYRITFGNDIASVRYRKLHCTACDIHIGSAPSQAHNMLVHPVLRTLLCARCREFYGDGTFEQGDDATDMFCRWCANGGNLYCCSYCSNTFCYKCIRRNFASLIRKKIEADEKWQCFVCNPTDLYDARAVCWALLQHVQTVTSILEKEKNMSSEEIQEKMNLDESECCPRRSKRRQKRRLESNSEEEDETYIPKINGIPITVKRKPYKKNKPRYSTTNGTKPVRTIYPPIPIRPRPPPLLSNQPNEPQTVYSQYEQPNKAGCQEAAVEQPEKIIIPPPNAINMIDSAASMRYDSGVISPSLYHTAIINQTSASTTYVRPMNSAFHHIILPSPPASQVQNYQAQSQSLRNSTNAMVSLSNNRYSSRFILPKAKASDAVTLTPNIIEIDSDSDDELKIVEQHDNMTTDNRKNFADIIDVSFNKIIPVALFSTENDIEIKEDQPLREMYTSLKKQPSTFSKVMLTHSQELDTFLGNVKENMQNFFILPDNETVGTENIKSMMEQKIKRFHRSMHDTIFQLAHINDRVIREYNKWKRSQKTETEVSSTNQSTVVLQADVDIPLHMTCINESDTESDYEESECWIMESSDDIKSSNILKDLLMFKKDLQHRGVGDSAITSENKAIQVYDVVSRDYEKCISYSLLKKTLHNEQTDKSVLESIKIPNKNFDKYQEQFIFYLQQEGYGIKTEDMKEWEDSDKTFEKLTAADSHTLHFRQNIDLLIESVEQSVNCKQEGSSDSFTDSVVCDEANESANTTDCKKITQINDLDSNNKIRVVNIRPTEEIQQIELQKVRNGATTLNNDDVNSSKNANDKVKAEVAIMEIEEDCTIIDG